MIKKKKKKNKTQFYRNDQATIQRPAPPPGAPSAGSYIRGSWGSRAGGWTGAPRSLPHSLTGAVRSPCAQHRAAMAAARCAPPAAGPGLHGCVRPGSPAAAALQAPPPRDISPPLPRPQHGDARHAPRPSVASGADVKGPVTAQRLHLPGAPGTLAPPPAAQGQRGAAPPRPAPL